MTKYQNLGGNSGVRAYEISADSIVVEFNDGFKYEYTGAKAGSNNISRMIALAQNGQGLGGYINTHVRKLYSRKFR
jgi:hypothetical protein